MKKVWIFALLLCLGIAGCGGRGNTAAPEAGTPEATKVVTEADPETEPVTEPAARIPGTAGEAPQPDQAWLPSLPIESAEEDCAHYRVEDEAAIEAYVERMEAAGFRRRDFDRRYLLWNDRVILEMVGEQAYEMEDYTYEGDPDRWTLRWQIAGPGAAPVDLAAVRAFLPGDELLCAVDQTPAGMYEATGLRLLGCAFLNVPSVMPGVRLLSPGDAVVFCQLLLGPDGCTVPGSYYSIPPQEALWTDVDGDEELEFVYWTYGPTSGLFTVALWAYGLEQGLPVLKAETIFNLGWSDEVGLDLENGLPVFRTAIAENPDGAKAPYYLGCLFYDRLQRQEAIKDKRHRAYLRRKESGWQAEYEAKKKVKRKQQMDKKKEMIRHEDVEAGIFIPASETKGNRPRIAETG